MSDIKKPTVTVGIVAQRLRELYRGNNRSTGRFYPATGKALTEEREATQEDFIQHVKGTVGVGVVPITDEAMCCWAALDIDNHGEDTDIPIVPVEEQVQRLGYPLVLCRSKSGGIHAYVFFKSPVLATKVRTTLSSWAKGLGHGGCEVFPKQHKLHRQTSGGMSLGNWINLPYMGGKDTTRYAVHNGAKIGLVEFLELAESKKITEKQLSDPVVTQYSNAPPCILKILKGGAVEGNRNEALFNTAVFLRKAYPDDFAERATELNTLVFSKPLGKQELERTVASAGRPDYTYRCNEEPIRSFCNREQCITTPHGITAKDADAVEAIQALPANTELVKYATEPVRWELKIGGSIVNNISTKELLDWRIMREFITERLMRVVPMIKNSEWERLLLPMMGDVRIVDTPDDASVAGVIRMRLKEFATKTNLINKGQDKADRQALLRGLPCVQEVDGERCVVFRAQDFISYLKRTKSDDLKGTNLWFAVKELGVQHSKMRVSKERNINVWHLSVALVIEDWQAAEPPTFSSEI